MDKNIMRVILASKNKDKIAAVRAILDGLYSDYTIESFQTDSTVNKQPIGDETTLGVMSRLKQISKGSDYDCAIAIENGIFIEDGLFVDRAVVAVSCKGKHTIVKKSDGVVFPIKYVELTSNTPCGFVHNTVGQIMQDCGVIRDNSDPHIDLCRKSRQAFIMEALFDAFKHQ